MSRRRARGFTLVEIMIALLVSALLVGMVLSIFSRMSLAFRTQQNVSELQQILSAAHDQVGRDLRQAGFAMPSGFFWQGNNLLHQPVEIENDADGFGPDMIKIYYGDASAQAQVTGYNSNDPNVAFTTLTVDDPDQFVEGDVAVIWTLYNRAQFAKEHRACVVQIETINANTFNIDPAGVYGSVNNDQCDDLRPRLGDQFYTTMIFRFTARAYRIDPNRRELGVLQVSPSGALNPLDDWEDLGVGFTDLQVASRWFEPREVAGTLLTPPPMPVDLDGDGDLGREWFSGADQEVRTAPRSLGLGLPQYQLYSYRDADGNDWDEWPRSGELRVSLAVRTHNKIDTVASARTPRFIDPANPDHNAIGDRDSVQLDGVPDASRPPELRGEHVYRYATVGSDLRNMVGQ